MTKVLVIGGAGKAGSIHAANLLEIGCDVAVYDFFVNDKIPKNINAKEVSYNQALAGYTHAVIALPDKFLHPETLKVLSCENIPKRLLIEKPGSLTSADLQELVDAAAKREIEFFINYQRSFDPRVKEVTDRLGKLVKEGYEVDNIMIHSCDKAVPPQSAHQIMNQGCHDYALLIGFLEATGKNVSDETMFAQGVGWGDLQDTKFVRMGGVASRTVFDVKISRVSSLGTYTKLEINLSKKMESEDMYEPVDINLLFPEEHDPDATWAETWKASFKESMRSFVGISGIEHVNAAFGVKVLKFGELALERLQQY